MKPAEQPPEIPLESDTPQGVLTNLRAALVDINTAIKAEEKKIVDLLEAAEADASSAQGNIFDIARPGIIDHRGSSVLEAAQLITVDDETIAKITELWIPTINGDVRACAHALTADAASWSRPANIGIDPHGPWSAYSTLQSSMVGHLMNLVDELSGAADSLQRAAALIGLTDAQTNARFTLQADKINSQDINTI